MRGLCLCAPPICVHRPGFDHEHSSSRCRSTCRYFSGAPRGSMSLLERSLRTSVCRLVPTFMYACRVVVVSRLSRVGDCVIVRAAVVCFTSRLLDVTKKATFNRPKTSPCLLFGEQNADNKTGFAIISDDDDVHSFIPSYVVTTTLHGPCVPVHEHTACSGTTECGTQVK